MRTLQTPRVIKVNQRKNFLSQPRRGAVWTAGGLCPCWFNLVTSTNILSGLSYHYHLVIIALSDQRTVRHDVSSLSSCQDMKNVLQILASWLAQSWLIFIRLQQAGATWYLQSSDWWLAQAGRLVAWRHREWETATSLVLSGARPGGWSGSVQDLVK